MSAAVAMVVSASTDCDKRKVQFSSNVDKMPTDVATMRTTNTSMAAHNENNDVNIDLAKRATTPANLIHRELTKVLKIDNQKNGTTPAAETSDYPRSNNIVVAPPPPPSAPADDAKLMVAHGKRNFSLSKPMVATVTADVNGANGTETNSLMFAKKVSPTLQRIMSGETLQHELDADALKDTVTVQPSSSSSSSHTDCKSIATTNRNDLFQRKFCATTVGHHLANTTSVGNRLNENGSINVACAHLSCGVSGVVHPHNMPVNYSPKISDPDAAPNFEPKTVVSFSKDLATTPNRYPDTVRLANGAQRYDTAHTEELLYNDIKLNELKFLIDVERADVRIDSRTIRRQ